MASTDWIQALKVVELKDELKKRGQPVAGKKAELIARLEAYINENEKEGSGAPNDTAEEAAAVAPPAEEPPAEIVEEEIPAPTLPPAAPTEPAAAVPAAAPAASPAADEKEKPKSSSAQKNEAPVADADAPHDVPDVDLDYEESDAEEPAAAPAPQSVVEKQPRNEEISKAAEEPDGAPLAAPKAAPVAAAAPVPAPLFAAAISTLRQPDQQPASAEVSRKRSVPESDISVSGAARPEKAPRVVGDTSKSPAPVVESHHSRALFIEGFVRPFTLNQARDLMGQSGTVLAMWMPTIKNLAYVIFSNKAEAAAAKDALKDLQWPAGSPKKLKPLFVSLATAEAAIGSGAGNPDFKVDRTQEDGPEDDVIASMPARAGNAVAAGKGEPQGEADASRAPPEGVADLRELLSKRRDEGAAPPAPLEGGVRGASPPRDEEMAPVLARPSLDDLFKKTSAEPAIYWVPKKPLGAGDVHAEEKEAGPSSKAEPAPMS